MQPSAPSAGGVVGRKNHYGSPSRRSTVGAAIFHPHRDRQAPRRHNPKAYLAKATHAAIRQAGTDACQSTSLYVVPPEGAFRHPGGCVLWRGDALLLA